MGMGEGGWDIGYREMNMGMARRMGEKGDGGWEWGWGWGWVWDEYRDGVWGWGIGMCMGMRYGDGNRL